MTNQIYTLCCISEDPQKENNHIEKPSTKNKSLSQSVLSPKPDKKEEPKKIKPKKKIEKKKNKISFSQALLSPNVEVAEQPKITMPTQRIGRKKFYLDCARALFSTDKTAEALKIYFEDIPDVPPPNVVPKFSEDGSFLCFSRYENKKMIYSINIYDVMTVSEFLYPEWYDLVPNTKSIQDISQFLTNQYGDKNANDGLLTIKKTLIQSILKK